MYERDGLIQALDNFLFSTDVTAARQREAQVELDSAVLHLNQALENMQESLIQAKAAHEFIEGNIRQVSEIMERELRPELFEVLTLLRDALNTIKQYINRLTNRKDKIEQSVKLLATQHGNEELNASTLALNAATIIIEDYRSRL